jgi:hypothetical protein
VVKTELSPFRCIAPSEVEKSVDQSGLRGVRAFRNFGLRLASHGCMHLLCGSATQKVSVECFAKAKRILVCFGKRINREVVRF